MQIIEWSALAWCLLPVALMLVLARQWQLGMFQVLVASGRMLVQLIAVGYALVFLFATPSPWLSSGVMLGMLCVAGWISVRPLDKRQEALLPAIIALVVSVGLHLLLSLFMVMQVEPWYSPTVCIPLAGLYLANTMNAISLSVERYHAELSRTEPLKARQAAFQAAMIPQINTLLAVGLVALPGMMTGQILSGVSPLIAVRYQIMIMAMLLGASGLGAAIVLWLMSRKALSKPSIYKPKSGNITEG